MTGLEQQRIFDRLLHSVPQLRLAYEEHIEDYDDVLPNVLGGDFVRAMARWEAESITCGKTSDRVDLILAVLEDEYATGNATVRELIGVAFVENLIENAPEYESIQQRLRPHLHEQLTSLREQL